MTGFFDFTLTCLFGSPPYKWRDVHVSFLQQKQEGSLIKIQPKIIKISICERNLKFHVLDINYQQPIGNQQRESHPQNDLTATALRHLESQTWWKSIHSKVPFNTTNSQKTPLHPHLKVCQFDTTNNEQSISSSLYEWDSLTYIIRFFSTYTKSIFTLS